MRPSCARPPSALVRCWCAFCPSSLPSATALGHALCLFGRRDCPQRRGVRYFRCWHKCSRVATGMLGHACLLHTLLRRRHAGGRSARASGVARHSIPCSASCARTQTQHVVLGATTACTGKQQQCLRSGGLPSTPTVRNMHASDELPLAPGEARPERRLAWQPPALRLFHTVATVRAGLGARPPTPRPCPGRRETHVSGSAARMSRRPTACQLPLPSSQHDGAAD